MRTRTAKGLPVDRLHMPQWQYPVLGSSWNSYRHAPHRQPPVHMVSVIFASKLLLCYGSFYARTSAWLSCGRSLYPTFGTVMRSTMSSKCSGRLESLAKNTLSSTSIARGRSSAARYWPIRTFVRHGQRLTRGVATHGIRPKTSERHRLFYNCIDARHVAAAYAQLRFHKANPEAFGNKGWEDLFGA